MIKMVEARDIEKGMVLSTDSMVVTEIEYSGFDNMYRIGGVCHGVWKEKRFNANDTLPIWYDDSDPED